MIEIMEVKEARYNSVDEVPIEKYKVLRNKKYCQNTTHCKEILTISQVLDKVLR